jgi:predicted nuclease of predicted toxin-antitoxin system
MKFLLDENAELRVAAFLRQAGHDVTSMAEDHPRSLPDEQVLAIANAERRILITTIGTSASCSSVSTCLTPG